MYILKKPKFWLLVGGVLLALLVLVGSLIYLLQPKTIGLYGLDPHQTSSLHLQLLLEKEGYRVRFVQTPQELDRADCDFWIASVPTDSQALQLIDAVGDKIVFIDREPALSQSVRYVGYDLKSAGDLQISMMKELPNGGDTNEDGTVTCLVLTEELGSTARQSWELGLQTGLGNSSANIQILETCASRLTAEAAQEAVCQALSKYGRDVEVILSSSEILAEGAAAAITGNGWSVNEDFLLICNAHSEQALEALADAQRSALAFSSQSAWDQALLAAISDGLKGASIQTYVLPFTPQTGKPAGH